MDRLYGTKSNTLGKKRIIFFVKIYSLSDTLVDIDRTNNQMVHAGSALNIMGTIPEYIFPLPFSLSLSLYICMRIIYVCMYRTLPIYINLNIVYVSPPLF